MSILIGRNYVCSKKKCPRIYSPAILSDEHLPQSTIYLEQTCHRFVSQIAFNLQLKQWCFLLEELCLYYV